MTFKLSCELSHRIRHVYWATCKEWLRDALGWSRTALPHGLLTVRKKVGTEPRTPTLFSLNKSRALPQDKSGSRGEAAGITPSAKGNHSFFFKRCDAGKSKLSLHYFWVRHITYIDTREPEINLHLLPQFIPYVKLFLPSTNLLHYFSLFSHSYINIKEIIRCISPVFYSFLKWIVNNP